MNIENLAWQHCPVPATTLPSICPSPTAGPMKLALDGMKQMMEGGEEPFDDDLYNGLVSCFHRFDPGLADAQDAAWDKVERYHQTTVVEGAEKLEAWLTCQQIQEEGGLVSCRHDHVD